MIIDTEQFKKHIENYYQGKISEAENPAQAKCFTEYLAEEIREVENIEDLYNKKYNLNQRVPETCKLCGVNISLIEEDDNNGVCNCCVEEIEERELEEY